MSKYYVHEVSGKETLSGKPYYYIAATEGTARFGETYDTFAEAQQALLDLDRLSIEGIEKPGFPPSTTNNFIGTENLSDQAIWLEIYKSVISNSRVWPEGASILKLTNNLFNSYKERWAE